MSAVGTTTAATASSTTAVSGTLPTGIQVGDLIFLSFYYSNGATFTVGPTINGSSTGIFFYITSLNAATGTTVVYCKIADGSESGGTVAGTLSANAPNCTIMHVRRNEYLDFGQLATGVAFGNSVNQSTAALSPSGPGNVINFCGGRGAADGTQPAPTSFGTFGNDQTQTVTTLLTPNRNIGAALATEVETGGAVAASTWTWSQSIAGARATIITLNSPGDPYRPNSVHPGARPNTFRRFGLQSQAFLLPTNNAYSSSLTDSIAVSDSLGVISFLNPGDAYRPSTFHPGARPGTFRRFGLQTIAYFTPTGGTAFFANITDSIAVSDSLTRLSALKGNLSDSIAVSDSLTRLETLIRGLTDSVAVSDSLTGKEALLRTLSDSIAVSDSLGRNEALVRALLDSVAISDVLTAHASHQFAAITDSVAISDILTAVFHSINMWTKIDGGLTTAWTKEDGLLVPSTWTREDGLVSSTWIREDGSVTSIWTKEDNISAPSTWTRIL